ncbi:putative bifunctional diguanylate cyclase/phosphodiesterase [Teredinibacter purpureus]|uniref:putative bifunctional diguanylate cyclase/phosphodiesterase n=1 Tax=Teredinibacter purpureus TaxID=2731756 RepID=UPI0005F82C88|nr:EAL domain-containing protein [Teredinibacter purpureus]
MQGFFHGISFRLAKLGVIIALLIGSLMSAFQIYIDFKAQSVAVNNQIASITDMSTPPAARAIHTLDNMLANEVAEGIMDNDFIVAVTIEDELGNEIAASKRIPRQSNTVWLTRQISEHLKIYSSPLFIPGHEKDGEHGLIKFEVDMDAVYSSFYEQSAIVIIIGLIRSFVLVAILFVAFHHLLTKPLIRIATQIKQINPGSPGEQRLSLPAHTRDDELKQLVNSGNQLLDAVDLALAKRRAVEVVLRKSEEHVRQIIDSLPVWVGARNKDGHYIFANKALADFLQTSPEAMRGSHISDFSEYFITDPLEVITLDTEVIKSRVSAQIWEEKWISNDSTEHSMHTHVMPMEFYDEVVALVVSSDITELKMAQAQMEHMAYHDALTDLPNRSYLVERLEEELRKSAKHHIYGALLFIDLDQFKYINDSLGHPAGDGVLKHVAERLMAIASDNDVVVRLGGDEFVVVLTDLGTDLPTAILRAEQIGERIRSYVSEPHFYNDLELHVTCSVGIVIYPEEDAGVHELLRYADTAMYQVKEQGRDAIQFFNKYMADNARNVLVMEGDLHRALETDAFNLYYQPRVDVETGAIVGAEALLRWMHPQRGMISPAEFIPILETSGLIVQVGMWVIERSLQQVKEWEHMGLWTKNMRLGVNISPRQFRSTQFVDDVTRILERENFAAEMLEMEITEGIVIHNLDETISTMATLQAQGINFALDDFGTGYSSISYLKKLPVAILKIDQSFVRDITEDRNDRVLVETISAMGNMLGLEVVAEGVETADQLDLIHQYGCAYYQGYLASRPVEPNKFELLLEKRVITISV